MFHPHFFHNGFFTGNPDALADAMSLVSACKVEQDLQTARREQQLESGVERIPERTRRKPIPFRVQRPGGHCFEYGLGASDKSPFGYGRIFERPVRPAGCQDRSGFYMEPRAARRAGF